MVLQKYSYCLNFFLDSDMLRGCISSVETKKVFQVDGDKYGADLEGNLLRGCKSLKTVAGVDLPANQRRDGTILAQNIFLSTSVPISSPSNPTELELFGREEVAKIVCHCKD